MRELVQLRMPSPFGEWFAVADAADKGTSSAQWHGRLLLFTLLGPEQSVPEALDRLTEIDDEQRDRLVRGKAVMGGSHPVGLAVEAYFAGEISALDSVTCEQPGGSFRQRAWEAMRAIPSGNVSSYAELAAASGNPKATRAAGTACAVNRIPLFIPCHRVVRSGGSLGNYYFGVDIKQRLLEHEGWTQ